MNIDLETASWIAGIIAATYPILSFTYKKLSKQKTDDKEVIIKTVQNNNSSGTQISSVNGNVIINNNQTQSVDDEQLDIIGKWDITKGCEIATSILSTINWFDIRFDNIKQVEHNFIGAYSLLYDNNNESMILAFASIDRDNKCHVSAPYLSFFEFEKKSLGWKLINSDLTVIQKGAWGEPPQMRIAAIGNERYGVLLESGYTAQGWTVGSTSIHTRAGDSFKEILHLMTCQSDPDGRSWDSNLNLIQKKTGLYDLDVSRTGENGIADLVWFDGDEAMKDDVADLQGNIRPHDIYKFNGQKYSRT